MPAPSTTACSVWASVRPSPASPGRQAGEREDQRCEQPGQDGPPDDGAQAQPLAAGRPARHQQPHEQGHAEGPDGGEDEGARQRHRPRRRLVGGDGRVPRPPPQLGPEGVEHLVEAVVDEAHRRRPHQRPVAGEGADALDQHVGQVDPGGVEGDDVERHAVVEELDREHVVHEDQPDALVEAEGRGEVQRGLQHQHVGGGRQPHRQAGRVAPPAPGAPGVGQGEHGAGHHQGLDHRQGPVLQPGGVAHGEHRVGGGAVDAAQPGGHLLELGGAGAGHGAHAAADANQRVTSTPRS